MTPAQQEEYMSYLASPAGTARLLVETNVKVAAYESQIAGLKVELAAMMKERDEEGLQRVSKERNNALIALDEARAAAQAQADEIACLKSDEYHRTREALIETLRKERDEALARERLHREARDAALLDLSQARAERDAMLVPYKSEPCPNCFGGTVINGRRVHVPGCAAVSFAAAVARAEAAEASAAAMREMLEEVVQACDQVPTDPKMFSRKAAIALVMMRGGAAMALTENAGRALLDRHAAELAQLRANAVQTVEKLGERNAELAQMREENARLKAEDQRSTEYLREVLRKVDEEQKGLAVCSWCALPTNSDDESKRAHQMTCPKSPIVALLGQAVAALQAASPYIRGAGCYFGNAGERDLCIGKGSNHSKRCGACQALVDVDDILTDSTATAAADAYRAQQEEREKLVADLESMTDDRDLWQELASAVTTGDVQDALRAILNALGLKISDHEVTSDYSAHGSELRVTFIDPKRVGVAVCEAITRTQAKLADVEARLLAAQAEAAAMRQAVIDEPEFPTPFTPEKASPFIIAIAGENGHHALQALAQVIVEATKQGILDRAGNAGRALAERVQLLEAVATKAQHISEDAFYTDAERIAQLEAELTEAKRDIGWLADDAVTAERERDAERAAHAETRGQLAHLTEPGEPLARLEKERTAHARTQAELIEARKERDSARFHIREDQKCLADANALIDELLPHKPSKCGNAIDGCGKPFDKWHPVYRCLDCDLPMHKECLQSHCEHELQKERASHARTQAKLADVEARLLAAQGEAVAMREALKGAKQWMFTHCDPDSENGRAYRRDKQAVMNALTGDAGHAIAERVPLWRDLETANRIESLNEHPHACPCARCVVLRKLAALDAKRGG